jgi:hypothetical protein
LLAFPGRHDDQVDAALTQGCAWGHHDWDNKFSVNNVQAL